MPQNRVYSCKLGRSVLPRTALGVALAAAMACANTVARAQDSDSPSMIGSIMRSFGLKAPGDVYDGIDYNERSPLVVPPSRDLPPPLTSNAPPVANWPKDADVERKKKAKKEEKPAYQKDYVTESSRALLPNELNVPGAQKTNAPGDADSTADSMMVDPRDQGAKKGLFSGLFEKKEQYATFTGEPSRQNLTDPPPGYLTPSPDQPYGVGPAESKYKIPTVADRMEPTR
jgi:hypothetical protein